LTRRTGRPAGGLLAIAFLMPQSAGAQRVTSSLELSGLKLRYADSVDASSVALSPGFGIAGRLASLELGGTFSRFDAGGWAAQGSLTGGVMAPLTRGFAGEVAGWAGGSTHKDGTSTGQAVGTLRGHLLGPRAGGWIGGGAGYVRTSDERSNSLRHLEAGGWTRLGRVTLLGSVSPTAVGDSIRYTDGQVFLRWMAGRVELSGSMGWRWGSRRPTDAGDRSMWGNGNAAVWVMPWLALTASGGSYPLDLTQGFPGGRYGSVGLRITTRSRAASPDWEGRHGRELTSPAEFGVSDFEVRPAAAGAWTVRVRAPGARSIELSGDFTGWEPLALTASGDGWWTARLTIPRGTHQVSVRRDGGRWLVPPGLIGVRDEFGGEAGILVTGDRPL
jgi:hypothetical protein